MRPPWLGREVTGEEARPVFPREPDAGLGEGECYAGSGDQIQGAAEPPGERGDCRHQGRPFVRADRSQAVDGLEGGVAIAQFEHGPGPLRRAEEQRGIAPCLFEGALNLLLVVRGDRIERGATPADGGDEARRQRGELVIGGDDRAAGDDLSVQPVVVRAQPFASIEEGRMDLQVGRGDGFAHGFEGAGEPLHDGLAGDVRAVEVEREVAEADPLQAIEDERD